MSDNSDSDKSNEVEMTVKERRFTAQGQYAESMVRWSLGDLEASIQALEHALEIDSGYAPAILSMGTMEYERGKEGHGKELVLLLVSLPTSGVDGGEDDLIDSL